ncbi:MULTISPECIES: hypothetical protein [Streptosporangium]|uniref:Uncharacterized protein n=1 Tax=Streptosporangium brasiliense TaxID=47480 RepID=A0ABT9R6T2_9ACTN|nr:hypothetical protein [Streptosporangium brasiliense]MDP9864954.1 hypothetical protein [Streptosporangium brasiliense]
MIQQVYADRLKTWADWQDLSAEAHSTLVGRGSRHARSRRSVTLHRLPDDASVEPSSP